MKRWKIDARLLCLSMLCACAVLLSGCKPGGLIGMYQDAARPMEQVSFLGTENRMTLLTPVTLERVKEGPLDAERASVIERREKYTGTGNLMEVVVLHDVLKQPPTDAVATAQRLDQSVAYDVEKFKSENTDQDVTIASNAPKTIHGQYCRLVVLTQSMDKHRYEMKILSCIHGKDAWCVVVRRLDADEVADKCAEQVIESFELAGK